MRRLINILSLITLLLAFSHNVSATRQARDMIIINKVEHRLNKVLLYQLDSVTYDALGKKLEFDKFWSTANWRGHISTFEVKGKKLYLKSIYTGKEHTDFDGLLDLYKDRKGRVFASWVSDTLICGTGECIYATESGFGSVHEQETELIVENGVIISSRTYFNKTNGTADLEDAKSMISQNLDLSKINAPQARATVLVKASEFNNEGKIIEWSIKPLRGYDGMSAGMQETIVKEINRVFNLIDWKTYCQDGKWHWIYPNFACPLKFNTSEDTIKSFLTKMYNDKLYEDYDFLQKHCSPELLKKLQDAYTYDSDGPAYAAWLFRSSLQDSKPDSDGKPMMLDVKADGAWYFYTALDMGWKVTNRIKVISKDDRIIIEDMDITGEWAKAFVRNSYLYHWHKTQDIDSTVMAFCELVKYLMPDIQLDPSAIKAYIMSAEKENAMAGEGEDILNIVTAGKYYTPLCRCDIYTCIKEQMSEEALAVFYNVYDSWKTDLKTALRAVKDKCYREISLELYGNDHDIIGNREIVRYLIITEN